MDVDRISSPELHDGCISLGNHGLNAPCWMRRPWRLSCSSTGWWRSAHHPVMRSGSRCCCSFSPTEET